VPVRQSPRSPRPERGDYIAAETLTVRWAQPPLTGDWHRASVKVDGQPLEIALRKFSPARE
jgi:hypothetical protein